jgi:hypothetical protein
VHTVVVSPSFIGGLVVTLGTILVSFLSCAILALTLYLEDRITIR